MRIKYWKSNEVKVVMEGQSKVLYIPEKKFAKLFPLAYRRHLEVVAVHEDENYVIVATYLPEQKQPRLRKVLRAILFGDIKRLTDVVP